MKSCNRRYTKMRSHATPQDYTVRFYGRDKKAIGITYWMCRTTRATSVEEAMENIRSLYQVWEIKEVRSVK